jgi:hypothetical protein
MPVGHGKGVWLGRRGIIASVPEIVTHVHVFVNER